MIVMRLKRLLTIAGIAASVLLYAAWLAIPVNTVNSDIGRHLMNGEVIGRTPALFHDVTHTNFYSSTHPKYPAINHHWFGGVLLRFLFRFGGWTGMHLLYVIVGVATLAIFLDAARRASGSLSVAARSAIAVLPLLSERLEVRPEGFAYLFAAVILWILIAAQRGSIAPYWRYALIPLILLWTNVHASFPVGLLIIGSFCVAAFLRRRSVGIPNLGIRSFFAVFVLCGAVTILNPNGIAGALNPLFILRDAGYPVVENQSVFFLERLGYDKGSFLFLKAYGVLFLIGMAFALRGLRERGMLPYLLVSLPLFVLAFTGARHITMLGFLLIPSFAVLVAALRGGSPVWRSICSVIAALAVTASLMWQVASLADRPIAFGLRSGAPAAAEFLKRNAVQGPFFHNFDIAGYLIFHFFPEERVFATNVPEAHPAAFWQETYIPMLSDETVWRQKLGEYGFNALVLYHGDLSAGNKRFMAARAGDPAWAPVFLDDQVIVFVRRTPEHAALIARYAIPPSEIFAQ